MYNKRGLGVGIRNYLMPESPLVNLVGDAVDSLLGRMKFEVWLSFQVSVEGTDLVGAVGNCLSVTSADILVNCRHTIQLFACFCCHLRQWAKHCSRSSLERQFLDFLCRFEEHKIIAYTAYVNVRLEWNLPGSL